jgi:ankyrin repeat protein
MSDALPLPPRPNLGHYKKRAKDLVRFCRSGDRAALRAWVAEWVEALVKLHGLDVELPRHGHRAYTPAEVTQRIERTVDRVTKHLDANNQSSGAGCTLARAQFALAREHGFASWPRFVGHLKGLARGSSPFSKFEAAVEAVVNGDLKTLEKLLRENPELVRARSTREHRSTLLHYVSANGVEDFRQKTPANIVAITKMLLETGAEVNAESEAYGGGSTTLGLVATSIHPEQAGVQIELLETLLDHGAEIDHPGLTGNRHSAVRGCLANGCGEAARFFAGRGARLDLEEAAGVGYIEDVKSFFDARGRRKASASKQQMEDGFLYACGYGHPAVVRFFLERGVDPDLSNGDGRTGLHWAMFGPHIEVIKLLLKSGAKVNVREKASGATPLSWAIRNWIQNSDALDRERYCDAVRILVRGGASVDPRWYEDAGERETVADGKRLDARMRAALRGETGR